MDLNSLLVNSKKLTNHIQQSSTFLPTLSKTLTQIQQHSLLITDTHQTDTLPLLLDIQPSTTLEPLAAIHDTDLHQHLTNTHDTLLSCLIQQSRSNNIAQARNQFINLLHSQYSTSIHAIDPSSLYSPESTASKYPLPTDYSLSALSNARLSKTHINIISFFQQLSANIPPLDHQHDLLYKCWDLLSTIFNQPSNKCPQISWLQNSYLSWLQNHVRSKRAEIGGLPTLDAEIDAFINLRFKRHDSWSLEWIDTFTVPNTAFWAHVYFLIRCGKQSEALEYTKRHSRFLENTTDRSFSAYLSSWISNNGILPKASRDRLLSEWNGHIRDILADTRIPPRGDVFKYTLYKILGRCEMSCKTIKCEQVITSTDDYLWLQLMLINPDSERSDIAPFEKYTLADFSSKMIGYGQAHFKSTSVYFMVLLLCGEYERAVDLLVKDPVFCIHGLHFSIALVYLGALHVPSDPSLSSMNGGLLSTISVANSNGNISKITTFDFAHVLLNFVKEWSKSDPVESLHYVYTLGLLCGPLDQASTTDQQKSYTLMVYAAIREVILASNQLNILLGDIKPDGTRVPGEIEKYKSLIYLQSTHDFLEHIVFEAAQLSQSKQTNFSTTFQQTIQLYHLAERYEYVITLLNNQMCDMLSSRQYSDKTTPSGIDTKALNSSFPSTTNIVDLSEQLLVFYKSKNRILSTISPKIVSCCSLLISLHRFMVQSDSGKDEAALLLLERLDLIPLDPDMGIVQRKVDQFRGIDESISRVIPEVLVSAMKSIEKLYTQIGKETTKQARLNDLRGKAKALLMFAGCIQYRISGDVFATLNMLDVMMS